MFSTERFRRCNRGHGPWLAASRSSPSPATCCAGTRWATRTSGRCGSTCHRATETRAGRFPSVYLLPGYGGIASPPGQAGRSTASRFRELTTRHSPRAGRARGRRGRVDGWTRYGGSQYVDSAGTGRYHSYLCDEIVRYVDGAYRTIAARDHRAVIGQVIRRIRGAGRRDAAAGRVRRLRESRRRRVYESPTCPGCRGSPGRCGP